MSLRVHGVDTPTLAAYVDAMAINSLRRFTFRWSGPVGLPGYTNLYFDQASATTAADNTAAVAFMTAAAGPSAAYLPSGVTITPPSVCEIINALNGDLTASEAVTAGTPITGTGSGSYAAATGSCITWVTAGIETGATGKPRKVRGRTFLVPVGNGALDSNGTLGASYLTAMGTAAAALIAASSTFAVWHRPIDGQPSSGMGHEVIGYKITDQTAVLRSRRN